MEISWNFESAKNWEPCIIINRQTLRTINNQNTNYIKDTSHFLNLMMAEKLTDKDLLVTIDIFLYTYILIYKHPTH